MIKSPALVLLALGLFALAGSIGYFSYALLATIDQLPLLARTVKALADTVDPILEESRDIREQTALVMVEVEAVRSTVPGILDEVSAVRELVPGIVDEVGAVRQAIPVILEESAQIRKESAAIRAALPAVLDEMAAYRELSPHVLAEVAAVREAVPPTLDRSEAIVAQLDVAASKVGEGVVSGLFTGIIKAPVSLISGMASVVTPSKAKLSPTERARAEGALANFVESAGPGEQFQYTSTDGMITWEARVLGRSEDGSDVCKDVDLQILSKGKLLAHPSVLACSSSDGDWTVAEKK